MTSKKCLVLTSWAKNGLKVRVAGGLGDLVDIEMAKKGVFEKCNVGSELSIAYFKRASFGVYKSPKSPCPPEKFHNRKKGGKRGENDQKVRIVGGLGGHWGHINNGVMGILTLFGVMAIVLNGTDCVYVNPLSPLSPQVPLKNFTIEQMFNVGRLLSLRLAAATSRCPYRPVNTGLRESEG